MKLSSIDVTYLYDQFCERAEHLQDTWVNSAHALDEKENPEILAEAMTQLIDVLRVIEETQAGEIEAPKQQSQDINTLTQYGLQLLCDMSQIATELELSEEARELENLCLPLAVWSARHGGEIHLLAPVVNALAYHANYQKEPRVIQELYALTGEVFEAVSPSISQDLNKSDVQRPWRLLLINRAIVATKTLNPSQMEQAFDTIVECLPNDASRFFEEAVEQLDVVGYPDQVRDIINRYYLAFAKPQILH